MVCSSPVSVVCRGKVLNMRLCHHQSLYETFVWRSPERKIVTMLKRNFFVNVSVSIESLGIFQHILLCDLNYSFQLII